MKERVFTVVYMVVITAIATALMTGAKVLVEDRIRLNEKLHEHRAELFGLGFISLDEQPTPEQVDMWHAARVKEDEVGGRRVLLGYDESGKALQAIGIIFEGQGFWGPIRGILSADPEGAKIVGMVILNHQETPGLGGRITEQEFLGKFIGRETPAAKQEIWQRTDAITGATRTSESMEHILNHAAIDLQTVVKEKR